MTVWGMPDVDELVCFMTSNMIVEGDGGDGGDGGGVRGV